MIGCVGKPWTMQEIGLPTYWVAVITIEHVKSSTVVKWLCNRNTIESVVISCHFKYCPRPPSSLYMIVFFQSNDALGCLQSSYVFFFFARYYSHVVKSFTNEKKKQKRKKTRETRNRKNRILTETFPSLHLPRSKSGKTKRNRHTIVRLCPRGVPPSFPFLPVLLLLWRPSSFSSALLHHCFLFFLRTEESARARTRDRSPNHVERDCERPL